MAEAKAKAKVQNPDGISTLFAQYFASIGAVVATTEAAQAREALVAASKMYEKFIPEPLPVTPAVGPERAPRSARELDAADKAHVPGHDDDELLEDDEMEGLQAAAAKKGGTQQEQFKRMQQSVNDAVANKRRKSAK